VRNGHPGRIQVLLAADQTKLRAFRLAALAPVVNVIVLDVFYDDPARRASRRTR
jgi:hypothetical protein